MLHTRKKICALSLCSAALLLTGCEFPGFPETTGVYNKGFEQFHLIYDDLAGNPSAPASASKLLKDPKTAGQAAVASDGAVNDQTPLYAQYSYYLPSLSGDEKENFDALYKGIQNFEESISLPHPDKSEAVDDLMSLLLNECPELLQLDNTWTTQENLLHSVTSVKPSYLLDEKEYKTQLLDIVSKVAAWQTDLAGKTAFEAELAIFDDIVANCEYSSTAKYCQSAYGALVDGKAKCDGRAKAMVWGLRSLGITCSVITGNEHAWIIAHIGDYDYNVDPTFDDNEYDGSQMETTYTHFNVPESSIAGKPYPADDFFQRRGYPDTTHWEANYHRLTGRYIAQGENASAMFNKQLEDAYANGGGFINIRFETKEDYKAAAEEYASWIQSFINRKHTGCNLVTYDCSEFQTLAIRVSFNAQ